MRLLPALAIAALTTMGCKGEDVSATVNCKVNADSTVGCTISETKGQSEVEVCWDFKVHCASGATLEAARTCGKVKDGQTTAITIPAEKLTVVGACEGEMSAAVTNLTLNGKQFEK